MPTPIGFLRSLIYRKGPISVREANEVDLPAVQAMSLHASRTYSGYGGAMQESLYDDVFLVAWQADGPAGLLMAHCQGPQVAWIYALTVANDVSLSRVGQALLLALEQRTCMEGVTILGYMDESSLSWLRRLLEDNGFHRHTRVVGYEAPALAPPDYGNTTVWVRPVRREDIPAIAFLDQAAFGPLWAYGERVFENALDRTACFLMAGLQGNTLGYILGTLHEKVYAHVVRLAVHPHWQGQHIGTRLLAEAFDRFKVQGAQWVGLNTQEENYRSQDLYRRFGFRPTGDTTGVWAKKLVR